MSGPDRPFMSLVLVALFALALVVLNDVQHHQPSHQDAVEQAAMTTSSPSLSSVDVSSISHGIGQTVGGLEAAEQIAIDAAQQQQQEQQHELQEELQEDLHEELEEQAALQEEQEAQHVSGSADESSAEDAINGEAALAELGQKEAEQPGESVEEDMVLIKLWVNDHDFDVQFNPAYSLMDVSRSFCTQINMPQDGFEDCANQAADALQEELIAMNIPPVRGS